MDSLTALLNRQDEQRRYIQELSESVRRQDEFIRQLEEAPARERMLKRLDKMNKGPTGKWHVLSDHADVPVRRRKKGKKKGKSCGVK